MLIQFYTPLAYCIKRESLSPHASGGEQTSFFCNKKFLLLLPLMSRICKLCNEVKREFSDFGENLSSPVDNLRKIVNLLILRLFLMLQENELI